MRSARERMKSNGTAASPPVQIDDQYANPTPSVPITSSALP